LHIASVDWNERSAGFDLNGRRYLDDTFQLPLVHHSLDGPVIGIFDDHLLPPIRPPLTDFLDGPLQFRRQLLPCRLIDAQVERRDRSVDLHEVRGNFIKFGGFGGDSGSKQPIDDTTLRREVDLRPDDKGWRDTPYLEVFGFKSTGGANFPALEIVKALGR